MVCHYCYEAPGARDHGAHDLRFRVGWDSAAELQADTVHAEKGFIGVNLRKVAHRKTASDRIDFVIQSPAQQHDLIANVTSNLECSDRVIGEDGDACVFGNVMKDLRRSSAAIDKNDIPIFDQRGRVLADQTLLLRITGDPLFVS